jgi:hypothetical protein
LVSALATSGLGYIYEDALGALVMPTVRTAPLTLRPMVTSILTQIMPARLVCVLKPAWVTFATLTIKYGSTSSAEESAFDAASIGQFGTLAQIITTTLEHSDDAIDQANFYLSLRAQPQPIFSEITFDLTNPEIDDGDRDNLINVFMGEAIALNNLPLNMASGTFQGFVEGWSFQASFNQLERHVVVVTPGLFIAGNALE